MEKILGRVKEIISICFLQAYPQNNNKNKDIIHMPSNIPQLACLYELETVI